MPILSMTSATPGQRFNALKHGRHAETLLLPGEDVAEFRRRRRAAFHTYRPQTEDEAQQVEAMVEHRWRLERWRPLEALLDGQAVLPAADAAGRVSEPNAHQRLHSSMDATLHRGRLERLWDRALSRLLALQDQRRKGLIAGAERLPEGCYLETDGQLYGPVAPRVRVPVPEPDFEADEIPADASSVTPIGNSKEQKERPIETGIQSCQPKGEPVGRASAGGLPEAPGDSAPAGNIRTYAGSEPGFARDAHPTHG